MTNDGRGFRSIFTLVFPLLLAACARSDIEAATPPPPAELRKLANEDALNYLNHEQCTAARDWPVEVQVVPESDGRWYAPDDLETYEKVGLVQRKLEYRKVVVDGDPVSTPVFIYSPSSSAVRFFRPVSDEAAETGKTRLKICLAKYSGLSSVKQGSLYVETDYSFIFHEGTGYDTPAARFSDGSLETQFSYEVETTPPQKDFGPTIAASLGKPQGYAQENVEYFDHLYAIIFPEREVIVNASNKGDGWRISGSGFKREG